MGDTDKHEVVIVGPNENEEVTVEEALPIIREIVTGENASKMLAPSAGIDTNLPPLTQRFLAQYKKSEVFRVALRDAYYESLDPGLRENYLRRWDKRQESFSQGRKEPLLAVGTDFFDREFNYLIPKLVVEFPLYRAEIKGDRFRNTLDFERPSLVDLVEPIGKREKDETGEK